MAGAMSNEANKPQVNGAGWRRAMAHLQATLPPGTHYSVGKVRTSVRTEAGDKRIDLTWRVFAFLRGPREFLRTVEGPSLEAAVGELVEAWNARQREADEIAAKYLKRAKALK